MTTTKQNPVTDRDWWNTLYEDFGALYTISYDATRVDSPYGTRWRAVMRPDLQFKGCELTVLRGSAEELQRALREQEQRRPSYDNA